MCCSEAVHPSRTSECAPTPNGLGGHHGALWQARLVNALGASHVRTIVWAERETRKRLKQAPIRQIGVRGGAFCQETVMGFVARGRAAAAAVPSAPGRPTLRSRVWVAQCVATPYRWERCSMKI